MNQISTPPNNQKTKQPTNPNGGARWAWGIGIFYATFACSMLGLVFFCTTMRVDLVRDDYYQAGVDHQKRIDAESRALSLTVQPTVIRSDTGATVVTVPGAVEGGTIHLYKPDNPALDFRIPLATDTPTVIPADKLVSGRWTVDVTWRATGKTYAKALPYHH